jgi:hypothetical protein
MLRYYASFELTARGAGGHCIGYHFDNGDMYTVQLKSLLHIVNLIDSLESIASKGTGIRHESCSCQVTSPSEASHGMHAC